MKKNYLIIIAILIVGNLSAQQSINFDLSTNNFSRGWLNIYTGYSVFKDCFFTDINTIETSNTYKAK